MTLVSIRRVHTFFVLQRCFGIGDSFTKLLWKNINIHDSRTFWRARPGWLTPTWSLFSHRRYKQVLSTCHLLGLFSLPSKLSASPLDMWGLPIISTVDRKHESSQRGGKIAVFPPARFCRTDAQAGSSARTCAKSGRTINTHARTDTLLAVAHGETRGPVLHGSGVYSSQAQRTRSSEGRTLLQRCPFRWHEALWSWQWSTFHLIVKLTNRFRVFLFCVFFSFSPLCH